MQNLLCFGAITLILGFAIFFYLLNTARKKTPAPAAGKTDYTPVYVTLADRPDTIMRGMDKFVADGNVLFEKALGQAISEVREVELNGDPSSREVVVGGKDGGVWAFSNTGTQLWSSSLS